jgi:excisionase family DNA binding protein
MEENERTTSEAAEVFNVSHRDLLNLLAEGEIPLRDEGPGLLIQREKLLEYWRRKRAVAEEAMEKRTDEAQKLGLVSGRGLRRATAPCPTSRSRTPPYSSTV